jgi:hypothetical protein
MLRRHTLHVKVCLCNICFLNYMSWFCPNIQGKSPNGRFSPKLKMEKLTRTYAVKRRIITSFQVIRPPCVSTFLVLWGGLSKRQYISKDGIELQTSTERIESKLLKITPIFEYINSLLVKARIILIFRKKTSNMPVDNGSSLNIPITVKIIALTNRALIETSVLVV